MQIEINETEYCKLSVHYEEGFEAISQKKSEVLDKFKKMNVPGFRQGKAPIDAVKMHFKKQIDEQLKKELAENAYYSVLFEKKIKPFGQPIFSSLNLEGLKFTCDFVINKRPDFELKEYKNFEIPKPPSVSKENMVQKTLEDLRHKFGNTSPFSDDDFIQMNDNVIIDYDASADGNVVDFLCAKGELLTVGTTPFVGFDDNLLGMKVGETRTFKVMGPDAGKEEIIGKEIQFSVTLQNGSRIEPMPLDDELAKKIGFESLEMMKTQAAAMASNRVEKLDHNNLTDQAIKRLVANHEVTIPSWLSLAEAKLIASNNNINNWDSLSDDDRKSFISSAERNVKLSLVLDKIREIEPEAQLTDEEALNIIKSQVGNESNLKDIFKNMVNSGYLPMLLGKVRDEHTIDFVVKSCKVVE